MCFPGGSNDRLDMCSGLTILSRMRSGVESDYKVVLGGFLRCLQYCACEKNWIPCRHILVLFSIKSSWYVAGRPQKNQRREICCGDGLATGRSSIISPTFSAGDCACHNFASFFIDVLIPTICFHFDGSPYLSKVLKDILLAESLSYVCRLVEKTQWIVFNASYLR